MSATEFLASSTYSASDTRQVGRVYDMLTAEEAHNPIPRYYLVGAEDDNTVELPSEVYQVLRSVVEAMQKGLSVTISPTSQMLTTQQAADLLGISRPTLIKALDGEKLPYTRSGSHRRIALTDVLDYREERRRKQYAAIDALSVDVDETADIDQTLAELREARKAVAAKRRSAG
ncbi:DNA binding domain-containing protein, excisionase family [Brevibacterium sandarakinum]|uniref:DNA binding domain-containing protein, excisionase family n=1 Tax=Brevibacterium sandarakinum TaxID=629680 RepID=A0A1H1PNF2_BRESA|nr:helix-turn-helix domain-containing protein [Brevibacterium sandarakinum]MDN5587449.1 helix-turn-helix domain-containing protein [Brevibacterium sp.]MDN5658385.1 helix-turn-helix domain-containing protein [Brevibacterium sandarakinum]SDS12625.1 DNA binding domain-containing protein, excisionase family [Brevibacterium sandarakinum]